MKEWRGRMVKVKRVDAGRQYEAVKEHGFKRPESNQKAMFYQNRKNGGFMRFFSTF